MKLFICRPSPQAVTSEVPSPYAFIVWGPFSASLHRNLVASAGLPNPAINQRTCAFYAVLDLSLVHVEINMKTYYVAGCQLFSTGAGASRPCFLSHIQTHIHHNYVLLHPYLVSPPRAAQLLAACVLAAGACCRKHSGNLWVV